MKNAYEMFKTSDKVEKDGIWLHYGSFAIKIARAGGSNKRYAEVLLKKSKPYRRQLQTETLAPEVADNMMIEVYAETVALDWEGEIGPGGKKAPFSKDAFIKVMKDLPDLFADVIDQSGKAALFLQEEVEEDIKK